MSSKIYEICRILRLERQEDELRLESLNMSVWNNNSNSTNHSKPLVLLQEFIENFCLELPFHLAKLKLESERANIIKLVYPCILIFGILGNLLSLVVMSKITKRGINYQKFSFSLAILSFADLGTHCFLVVHSRITSHFANRFFFRHTNIRLQPRVPGSAAQHLHPLIQHLHLQDHVFPLLSVQQLLGLPSRLHCLRALDGHNPPNQE